jgi:hypothetical protein
MQDPNMIWFKDKVLPPIWLVMMRLLYVQQHLGKINWTMQFVLYRVIWLPEYSFKLRFWLGTEEAFCDHIWVLHRDEKKCKKITLSLNHFFQWCLRESVKTYSTGSFLVIYMSRLKQQGRRSKLITVWWKHLN